MSLCLSANAFASNSIYYDSYLPAYYDYQAYVDLDSSVDIRVDKRNDTIPNTSSKTKHSFRYSSAEAQLSDTFYTWSDTSHSWNSAADLYTSNYNSKHQVIRTITSRLNNGNDTLLSLNTITYNSFDSIDSIANYYRDQTYAKWAAAPATFTTFSYNAGNKVDGIYQYLGMTYVQARPTPNERGISIQYDTNGRIAIEYYGWTGTYCSRTGTFHYYPGQLEECLKTTYFDFCGLVDSTYKLSDENGNVVLERKYLPVSTGWRLHQIDSLAYDDKGRLARHLLLGEILLRIDTTGKYFWEPNHIIDSFTYDNQGRLAKHLMLTAFDPSAPNSPQISETTLYYYQPPTHTIGSSKANNEQGIRIVMHPMSKSIEIRSINKGSNTVSIFDMGGRRVYRSGLTPVSNGSIRINCSQLVNGMYFLVIMNEFGKKKTFSIKVPVD
jgi:hypothetical protein